MEINVVNIDELTHIELVDFEELESLVSSE